MAKTITLEELHRDRDKLTEDVEKRVLTLAKSSPCGTPVQYTGPTGRTEDGEFVRLLSRSTALVTTRTGSVTLPLSRIRKLGDEGLKKRPRLTI